MKYATSLATVHAYLAEALDELRSLVAANHDASVKSPKKELMALAEALLVLSSHRERSRSQDTTMDIPFFGEYFSLPLAD